MNFIKETINQSTIGGIGVLHVSCSGIKGSCKTSTDVKKAAEALDKSKNGKCNKT